MRHMVCESVRGDAVVAVDDLAATAHMLLENLRFTGDGPERSCNRRCGSGSDGRECDYDGAVGGP